jgi:branched-chain amino acid transport system permease protein
METSSVPARIAGVPPALQGVLPVVLALPVLALLHWGLAGSPFATYLLSIIGVNVILAVSLNIVNGMTGQFSIGHAGFMAVGAYIAGVLSLSL